MKRAILTILATALVVLAAVLVCPDWFVADVTPIADPPTDATQLAGPERAGTPQTADASHTSDHGVGAYRPTAGDTDSRTDPTDPRSMLPSGPSPKARLEVLVVRFDGRPRPRTSLTITRRLDPGMQHGSPEIHSNRTRTDADGRVVFLLPAGTYVCAAELGAELEVELLPGERKKVELQLPRGGQIHGTVVDENGKGIAAAEILLSTLSADLRAFTATIADDMGRFTLDDVTRDRFLSARHPDFAPAKPTFVTVTPGVERTIRITLSSAHGWLEGIVLDPDGAPVADARLRFGPDGSRHSAQRSRTAPPEYAFTNDDGRFASAALQPGPIVVQAMANGFGCFLGQVKVPIARRQQVRIQLEHGAALVGRVTDRSGEPLAGVLIHSGRRDSFGSRHTRSDGEGRFRLDDLPNGIIEFTAVAAAAELAQSQGLLTSTQLHLFPGQTGSWSPVFDFAATGVVSGRLIDERRQPLAGWRVVATAFGEAGSLGTDTGDDGSFALHGLKRDHNVRLVARPRESSWTSFPNATLQPVAVGGPPVEFVVRDDEHATGEVRGRIVAADGSGVPALVEIQNDSTRRYGSYPTNADGTFAIPGVPAGSLRILVRHPNHPQLRRQAELGKASTLDLGVLQLAMGGSAFGSIRGPDGRPPNALSLRVLDQSQSEVEPVDWNGSNYRTPLLTIGSHTLLIQCEGCAAARVPLHIQVGVDQQVDIELHRAAKTTLRVQGQVPASGDDTISIIVFDAESAPIWLSASRLLVGTAVFQAWLEPGWYSVVARDADGTLSRARFEVQAGRLNEPPPILLVK